MAKAVVLCILDGWGHRENGADNAIAHAKTPHWDHCLAHSPHTLLEASELNVGLPKDQMGNSEVGHMNIGAGRVILQDLPRIDEAIANNALKSLPSLKDFIKALKKTKGTCHLLGLLSSGGVHSHERHLKALAAIIAHEQIPVAVHAFLDGRDTPPKSAEESLASFLNFTQAHPGVFLASLGGRYYAMDRDQRWDRIQKAYEPISTGKPCTHEALSYLHESYKAGITDEFVIPTALSPYQGMKDGDGLLMANFRADRVRQILAAFLDPQFKNFFRPHSIKFSAALGFTEYSKTLNQWMGTLFPSSPLDNVLGAILSEHGLNQLRLAETEKYAHVTFFFNGGREEVFPGEDRILIPSPTVATYDLKPEMSAPELTDCLVDAIESQKYALIVVNYANADMVGHTGNFEAAQKAIETIDLCLGRIGAAVEKTGACLLITADHGNAEMMYDKTLKSPHTAHTTNPVPFVMFNGPTATLRHGKLCDIAPTILQILTLPQPSSMTGRSLLELKYG
ncbi:MAG: 2,3-bisphosphoglycerate-independent phosphoglycerate mutase [Alphaproteobacteria bacterium]|nr:2,3-bisphosphoglycerate-independent phosphoglycerate mutase [Alphaproteobacteria bacterium]